MTDVPVGRGEAILLAGLPGMGPRRLAALLDTWEPAEAWARATSGRTAALVRPDGSSIFDGTPDASAATICAAWRASAVGADPPAVAAAHAAAEVQVLLHGSPQYPDVLAIDLEPPSVLFARGDLQMLDRPRVAIVGTRRCTGVGAGVARELGRELAGAGIAVVSGLALGIDGAAHRGALDALDASPTSTACPVGVVGSGIDVVYPPRHLDLWQRVAAAGLLLSEAPLGCRPAAWRFPARNRVIAALADVVVVVESHAAGGSLHTVTEAERRDVPVLAVPGSVRNAASAGTNQLLADGCHPVRDVDDVLVALGLTPASRRGRRDRRPAPDATAEAVLEAFAWEPATLDQLVLRTRFGLGEVTVALEWLTAAGWIEAQGGWFERIAA